MEPIWPADTRGDDVHIPPPGRVDVYPVGLLSCLLRIRRAYAHPNPPPELKPWVWGTLRQNLQLMWESAQHGRWRDVKNNLNGYLAEPTPFPDHMRRCGSGWTRRRALRSLYRNGYR